jgi:hypothetical protein
MNRNARNLSLQIYHRLNVQQVFQVLLLDGENTGRETSSLRDARKLAITDAEFRSFLTRHAQHTFLVPESNVAMKDSYLNLDEDMRPEERTRWETRSYSESLR